MKKRSTGLRDELEQRTRQIVDSSFAAMDNLILDLLVERQRPYVCGTTARRHCYWPAYCVVCIWLRGLVDC
jgi:hypothetical protein